MIHMWAGTWAAHRRSRTWSRTYLRRRSRTALRIWSHTESRIQCGTAARTWSRTSARKWSRTRCGIQYDTVGHIESHTEKSVCNQVKVFQFIVPSHINLLYLGLTLFIIFGFALLLILGVVDC